MKKNGTTEAGGEPIDPEVMDEPIHDIGALSTVGDNMEIDARERALIDMQVATAKRYPRNLTQFRKTLKEYATATPEIAESMYYSLPRGKNEDGSKKYVEGPSVRLAEAAVMAWGNTRSGARPTGVDETHITCQGFGHDLERNNYVAFEVRRRITDSKARRFNDDMITVTGLAATKIVWRNAIFGIIPRSYIEEARLSAKACARGALKSVDQARKDALSWWTSLDGKPTEAQLLAVIGRPGWPDVTIDDLMALKGLRTALADGDTTLAAVLADVDAAPGVARPAGLSVESILKGKAKAADKPPAGAEPPKEEKPAAPAAASPDVADEPGVAEAAALFE